MISIAWYGSVMAIVLPFLFAFPVAAQNHFQLCIESGPFAPADMSVQGYQRLIYEEPIGYIDADAVGFGTGANIIIGGRYGNSDWSVILDAGVRLHTNREFTINLPGERRRIENKMTVFPITISVVRMIGPDNSLFRPFIGFGTGIYFSSWETKDYSEGLVFDRDWYKGSDISPGTHFLAGFDFKLYRDLVLKAQYRNSYVFSEWELENQDSEETIEIYDLNLGGTSFRFGLGYNF